MEFGTANTSAHSIAPRRGLSMCIHDYAGLVNRLLLTTTLAAVPFLLVAVALADLLGRAAFRLALQVLRLLAALFLVIAAAHLAAPFVSVPAPTSGSSNLSISSRHAARVSSSSR